MNGSKMTVSSYKPVGGDGVVFELVYEQLHPVKVKYTLNPNTLGMFQIGADLYDKKALRDHVLATLRQEMLNFVHNDIDKAVNNFNFGD